MSKFGIDVNYIVIVLEDFTKYDESEVAGFY